MRYLLLLAVVLTGCGKHTVTVFDSKDFYEKVLKDSSYTEQLELPSEPKEVNCIVYTGTTFDYDGTIGEKNGAYAAVSDSIFVYSPTTRKTYNLNQQGFSGIAMSEGSRGGSAVWKLCVYSFKVRHIIMKRGS